mgnify:CR=1 FL=1
MSDASSASFQRSNSFSVASIPLTPGGLSGFQIPKGDTPTFTPKSAGTVCSSGV